MAQNNTGFLAMISTMLKREPSFADKKLDQLSASVDNAVFSGYERWLSRPASEREEWIKGEWGESPNDGSLTPSTANDLAATVASVNEFRQSHCFFYPEHDYYPAVHILNDPRASVSVTEIATPVGPDTNTWTCRYCNSENKQEDLKCASCSAPKNRK